MKNIFTLALLFAYISTQAQTVFAPLGAEWYHDQTDGVFHSYYVKDTLIFGTTCREVRRQAITTPALVAMGLQTNDLPSLYIYNSADTVFMYNSLFGKFTPIFVFNVNDGDTVRLPILPPQYCEYITNEGPDSTFAFVVDSVRTVLYDTAHLKTVYTRTLGNHSDSMYLYYYSAVSANGAYAEKIGSLDVGLEPVCASATVLTDERCQLPRQIRCYSDPDLNIKLTTDATCGLPTTGIADHELKSDLKIFPDPASDVINIELGAYKETVSLSVINMTGVVVAYRATDRSGVTSIDVSLLPAGTYLIKIMPGNELPMDKKVSIWH